MVAAGVISPNLEKRSSRIMWKEKKIRLHLSAYVDAHVFALVEKSVLEDHRVSDQRVLCSRLRNSRLEYGGTVFFVPLQPWMDRHYPQKKNRDGANCDTNIFRPLLLDHVQTSGGYEKLREKKLGDVMVSMLLKIRNDH